MDDSFPPARLRIGAGGSTNVTAESAADHAADICMERLEGEAPALLIAFASAAHAPAFQTICARLRERTGARAFLGAVGSGAMAGRGALESGFALSTLGIACEGAETRVASGTSPTDVLDEATSLSARRLTLCFATRDVAAIDDALAADRAEHAAIIGGLMEPAAGQRATLVGGETPVTSGLVAASLAGDFLFDASVAQGCEPFGPVCVVTQAQGDQLFELSGESAINVLQRAREELDEPHRLALNAGVFIGRSVAAHKSHHGRADFVLSRVMRSNRDLGALSLSEPVRVGQTVRFHLRTPNAAVNDLTMLLGMQKLRGPARAVLMFSDSGRGEALHGQSAFEIGLVGRTLSPPEAGEELAKAGRKIDPASRFPLPIAGAFGFAPIGPVGDHAAVHSQATVLGVFRDSVAD
ncbi:MAG: FIST N-terminal domain-containing protein [Phycisphaerales bacterium]